MTPGMRWSYAIRQQRQLSDALFAPIREPVKDDAPKRHNEEVEQRPPSVSEETRKNIHEQP